MAQTNLGATPATLFDATAAAASLSKTLWPGPLTVALPARGSGGVAALTSGGLTVGGVFAPSTFWGAVLLDFAAVGAADQFLAVEIGRLKAGGAIAEPLCSASLKSITNSGTVANANPFTGAATPATTWRLFDLAALTNKGQLGQVLAEVGGAEDDTPCQLTLDCTEAAWYYALVTNLNALTEALCVFTPTGG